MKRATSVLLLVSLMASAAATGCNDAEANRPQLAPPTIKYELPVTKTITDFEEFPGSTEAIISNQVTSRVTGYMTEVKFKDGDLVKTNDLLFKIDPRQYKAELERAEGNLQQLEAHQSRTEKEYQRAKILLARAQISHEEYDRYESDFRETEAGVKLAKSNRDLAQLNYDWCEVRASSSGRLSRRMVDPGNLVRADDTVLTSIVSLDPIYVYFDVHEQAMLKIQRLLEQGKVNAPSLREVPVQINLSDEGEDSFPHTGIVDFTDNKVDINTGTLRFRAKLDNKDQFIIPGLVVRVRLPIGDPHPAIFIRDGALVTDQGEKGVYIIRERDDKGQPYPNAVDKKGKEFFDDHKPLAQRAFWSKVASPGLPHGGYVEIANGVREGDWVVVSDMQKLKNGKVVIAEKFGEGAAKPGLVAGKQAPMLDYVTYDDPITQTVTEYEQIQGESDAMFSVQVTARVSGYMTRVNFKDGDLVKEGDLLFEIDSRPFKAELDRAIGTLQQNEAHTVRLEKEYHRARNLIARGSISPEEFDRYESDFKESEAGVRLAKANRDLAQLNYDWCEVRASSSGRLSRRMVDPGNLVKADSTVLTSIVSLDPIYVYFDVHEQAMLRIKHLIQQGKATERSIRGLPVDVSLADEGGSDIQLIPSLHDVNAMPREGKNLIVVAEVTKALHVRVFDADGKIVVDTDEKRLTDKAQQIEDLRGRLESLWPPHKISGSEKDRLVAAITSIVGHTNDGDDNFPHSGLVDFTDNRVDFNRGTLTFRAKLENKDHLLTPGVFVRVRLPIGRSRKAVMIRERALVTDHKEKGVYILRDRDEKGEPIPNAKDEKGNPVVVVRRAEWTKIGNPGVLRDGYVEIAAGVHLGDRVVVSGMQRLRNGKLVRFEKFSDGSSTDAPGEPATAGQPLASADETVKPNSIKEPRDPSPASLKSGSAGPKGIGQRSQLTD